MASENILSLQLILRNDTEDNWQLYNPTLEAGEVGVSFDNLENPTWKKFKIGDGVHTWKELEYTSDLDILYMEGEEHKSIRAIAQEEASKHVLTYATKSALPSRGNSNTLYAVLSEKATYVWNVAEDGATGEYICVGSEAAEDSDYSKIDGGTSYN